MFLTSDGAGTNCGQILPVSLDRTRNKRCRFAHKHRLPKQASVLA
jgi:hypothetical protein